MWLSRKFLTADALFDDVLRVPERSGPVEPRSKGFCNESSTARMMSAGPCMYVSKDGFTIFVCYAPLEYPRDASFVEFTVDDGV